MTRDEIWARLRALWETTERSALAVVRISKPAWARVRELWQARGRLAKRLPVEAARPVVPPKPPVEEATDAPDPRRPRSPERRLSNVARRMPKTDSRLESVDDAIQRQDAAGAMQVLQPMMLEERVGAELLKRAARVMRLLNEDGFAMLFDAAVASPATGPAIDLASSFLAVDDARMALAMARMALRRGGDDDPMVQALLAEGYARIGEHQSVLETLERFVGDWPEPTLLRRYALSALLVGDDARWAAVEGDLAKDRHAGWIFCAATRYRRYSESMTPQTWFRDVFFAQYGSLLLHEEPVAGQTISAHALSQVMTTASAALTHLDAVPDRIAHIGKSGEVFAHWLGQALEVMVMPLSARITGQSVLVVVADDAEMERVMDEPRYAEGALTVFQVVKAPSYSGVGAPDMIGFLAPEAQLPIEPVIAARAADRLPPRLMVAELERRASAMLAIAEPLDDALDAWLDLRRDDLALCTPASPHLRPPYVADLSQPPSVVEEEVTEDADEATNEELELSESGGDAVIREPSEDLAEVEVAAAIPLAEVASPPQLQEPSELAPELSLPVVAPPAS
jgi:hypothetical protein